MIRFTLAALVISLVLAGLLSPYSSTAPDGLEAAVGWLNGDAPEMSFHTAPLNDYTIPGIDDEATAMRLSGIIGTLAVFGIATGLGVVLRRRTGR